MKILVLNGPNLNLLGIREPEIYGHTTYADLERDIQTWAAELALEVEVFQSNHEGILIDKIQAAYQKTDGILFNPAGYTMTSVALLDALKAVGIPAVEIHISDLSQREKFRQFSYIQMASFATIMGEGIQGYRHGLQLLKDHINSKA